MGEKMSHGATSLANGIIETDAAFFNGNQHCPCTHQFAD
jgi:hypothetical protein